jgi:hypothetical protein
MKTRRFAAITPGTVIALVALFFALGGTAFAVGERVQGATVAQQRCANGAVRGVAHVTGGPSGVANIPGQFTGTGALFGRKFNCTGRAVQVRRIGIGNYEVRFVGNGAPNAVGGGVAGSQVIADWIAPGTFRVATFPAGRASLEDLNFIIVLV